MWGCLLAGLLVIVVFALVPIPLWPILVVALIVLAMIAAALGLFRGILRAPRTTARGGRVDEACTREARGLAAYSSQAHWDGDTGDRRGSPHHRVDRPAGDPPRGAGGDAAA